MQSRSVGLSYRPVGLGEPNGSPSPGRLAALGVPRSDDQRAHGSGVPLLQRRVPVRAVLSSPVGRSRPVWSGLLSWGSSKIASPPISTGRVHSQARRISPFGGKAATLSRMFRPCRFSRLRRFTPRPTLQVYCALQPVMGFAAFRVGRWLGPKTRPAADLSRQRGTLRSFSLTDSRSASPQSLPSRR